MAVERQTEGQPDREQQLSTALTSYLDRITGLGLIDNALLGIDQTKGISYFVNVFAQETRLQDAIDPSYAELAKAGSELEWTLEGLGITAEVVFVNPSDLEATRSEAEADGISLGDPIYIPAPSSPSTT